MRRPSGRDRASAGRHDLLADRAERLPARSRSPSRRRLPPQVHVVRSIYRGNAPAAEATTMGGTEVRTETIRASEAHAQWSQLLNRVSRRQVRMIVEKDGIPVAALISTADLERLARLEAEWDAPFRAIDQTRAAFSDVPDEELEREVAKAVTEARAELRAERQTARERK
jgi:prevent-host-death family protein